MPIMQDKNKPPQVNINPFGGGCDCRHDLDHLTPTERKSRLKYEHIQRCFSAATTVLAVMALLGAFLLVAPYSKLGEYQMISTVASAMFVICTPCAVFGVIIKLVFWNANKYESFQRPCHYNTLGDDDEE